MRITKLKIFFSYLRINSSNAFLSPLQRFLDQYLIFIQYHLRIGRGKVFDGYSSSMISTSAGRSRSNSPAARAMPVAVILEKVDGGDLVGRGLLHPFGQEVGADLDLQFLRRRCRSSRRRRMVRRPLIPAADLAGLVGEKQLPDQLFVALGRCARSAAGCFPGHKSGSVRFPG